MTVATKIRVYELAKEVKKEPKHIIEDARRFGVDVSVPSNSVPKEIADRIREKYDLGKKDVTPKRGIVVFKKQKTDVPVTEVAEVETTELPKTTAEPSLAEQQPAVINKLTDAEATKAPVTEPSAPTAAKRVVKVVAKPRPQSIIVQEEQQTLIDATEQTSTSPESNKDKQIDQQQPVAAQKTKSALVAPAEIVTASPDNSLVQDPTKALEANSDAASTETPAVQATGPKVFTATSGVRKLTLSKDALNKGFRPGERVNIPQPSTLR